MKVLNRNMLMLVLVLSLVCDISHLYASDPTEGFTNIPLTEANFKIQRPYNLPVEARYSFENGVRRMWVYANDKSHSPNSQTQPRTEVRIMVLVSIFT